MKILAILFTAFISFSALAGAPDLPKIKPMAVKPTPTNPPPIIQSYPSSIIVTQGRTAKFSISATAPKVKSKPQPLKFQWLYNTNAISTATNSTLTVTNTQYANRGMYSVQVSSPGSPTVTAKATLTVLTTNILSACITTNNSLAVVWDYDFTNNPDVGSFNIYYGTATNNYMTNIVAAPSTATIISNLITAQTYYLIATAVSTNHFESPPSPQLSYTFGYACGIPFTIDIMMLTNNVPRLTAKLCPSCVVQVQRTWTLNFPITWTILGNVTADAYGNVIFDDLSATNNMAFYRMVTQ